MSGFKLSIISILNEDKRPIVLEVCAIMKEVKMSIFKQLTINKAW